MSKKKNLIKGSFLKSLELVLQLAFSFIMTPIIVHSLGERMYGFWILIGTFIGYYGLLDLGLSTAVARYVARAVGKYDEKEINHFVNTSFVLFFILGAIGLAVTLIVCIIGNRFVSNPGELALFRRVIIILGINMSLRFPFKVFGGLLNAYLRYDLITYSALSRLIISNILVFYLIKTGHGILALAVVTFLCSILEEAMNFIFSRQVFPQLKINYSFFKKDMVKPLYGYSLKSFISQIADILKNRIDAFVIAAFINVGLVTYYSIGIRVIEYFYQFIRNTVNLTKPIYSQYDGMGDHDLLKKIFLQITKLSVVVSVFIGMSIIFYGKPLIQRWMGPGFERSYYVTVILCIPWTIDLIQSPANGVLYGISKHHYFAIANPIEGVLNLALSIILLRYYGIYGVALGTALPMTVFRLFIQPTFVCRVLKLSKYKYYFETISIPLLKTLIPLLLYFYIVTPFLRASYINIVIIGIMQIVFFIPVVLFLLLNKKERRIILNELNLTHRYNVIKRLCFS